MNTVTEEKFEKSWLLLMNLWLLEVRSHLMRDEQKRSAAWSLWRRDEALRRTYWGGGASLVCNRDTLFGFNPDRVSERRASALAADHSLHLLWGSRRKPSGAELSATTQQKVKRVWTSGEFCVLQRELEVRLYSSMLAKVSLRGYNV